MGDWPNLSAGALRRIKKAEVDLSRQYGEDVNDYVPVDLPRDDRRSEVEIRTHAYTIIDFICDNARQRFDAYAVEYFQLEPLTLLSSKVLEWISQRVYLWMHHNFFAWLLVSTSHHSEGNLKAAGTKAFLFEIPAYRVGQEIKKPIRFIGLPRPRSGTKLTATLNKAYDRMDHSVEVLLNDCCRVWAEKATALVAVPSSNKSRDRGSMYGSTAADRRAAVDAYIEEVRGKKRRITRTDIWKVAKYKSRAEFERWESCWYEKHGKKPNQAAHQRFTRILSDKPHLR